MSVTQLNIDVKIQGADDAAQKLKKVEDAADGVGKKTEKAGGLFAAFEGQVRKLDDAVDKVEKPMRTFSGALDIASIALGVGLAGPLGAVIQQLVELGKGVLNAALSMDEGGQRAADYAARIKKVGEEARTSASLVKAYEDVLRGQQGGALTPEQQRFVTEQALARQKNLEQLTEAQKQYNASVAQEVVRQAEIEKARQREAEAGGAINLRVSETVQSVTSAYREQKLESDRLAESIRKAQAEESRFALAESELQRVAKERVQAEQKKTEAINETAKANTRAAKAATDRSKAVVDAYASEISIMVEAEREAQKLADERAAYDAMSPLQFIESLPPVTPTLAASLGDLVAADKPVEAQATAAEQSLTSLTQSAMDLESMGVGALQSFSQAAGQALATLVIDGDKAGVSFKRLAGQVAAGLSAQAFGYAVFLSALGVAAALTGPVLGYTAPGLFQGAAVMAGTGLLLAGTARALGASTVGSSSVAASAAGSAGGAQDRVSSFSAGGGGAQPMQVTVVLGVDEVSNVLVRQSQREARSGSLSTSRLAVA